MKTNPSTNNKAELLKNGLPFINKVIDTIKKANEVIFFHAYIFDLDEVTGPIVKALQEKAQSGVKVYFICDGIGSTDLSDKEVEIIIESKINFAFFRPVLKFNHIGRRLHQKVLIVDQMYAIVGGINFAKEFNLPESGSPWLDYACYIEGEEVHNIFLKTSSLYLGHFKKDKAYLSQFFTKPIYPDNLGNILIKSNLNDFMRNRNEIYKSYLKSIKNANESIIIMATYFIPGKKLLRALKKARKRGVKVILIFGSMSDHPIVNRVEQYFYHWYFLNDFEIYEWNDSVIHGKIALIDNKWVTIGSYNHNYISRYGNLEINLEIINNEFALQVANELKTIINQSSKINNESYSHSHRFYDYIFNTFAFFLTNFVSFISLCFIYKKSKKNSFLS